MIDYENLGKLNASFRRDYEAALREVLDSGWFVLGKKVETFERDFARWCGVGSVVGVSDGLDALVLCLRALELPPCSEIIVPSNTYIATILAIVQAGHVPILVEPDIRTYNIDPAKIEAAISPRTKILMPVHLYGKICAMDAIMEIARRRSLAVIEDAAQAHGAALHGKKAGTWGTINAFSFYPTKNLGALGDAGAVSTDDAVLADKVRTLRNYGSKVKYYNEVVGFNSRLDELQAAFLSVKLRRLDEINTHKRKLAAIYEERISGERFAKPVLQDGYDDVFHIYNIRHPDRDRLRAFLLEKGVKTDVHYPVAPVRQAAMKGIIDHVSCPIAEEIHATTLSLPISFFHTEADVNAVCDALEPFE